MDILVLACYYLELHGIEQPMCCMVEKGHRNDLTLSPQRLHAIKERVACIPHLRLLNLAYTASARKQLAIIALRVTATVQVLPVGPASIDTKKEVGTVRMGSRSSHISVAPDVRATLFFKFYF